MRILFHLLEVAFGCSQLSRSFCAVIPHCTPHINTPDHRRSIETLHPTFIPCQLPRRISPVFYRQKGWCPCRSPPGRGSAATSGYLLFSVHANNRNCSGAQRSL